LIVGDNASGRRVLAKQISTWEMIAEEAANVHSAFGIWRQAASLSKPFDVVLIDAEMSNGSGSDLARAMQTEAGAVSRVRIALLASLYGVNSRHEIEELEAGAVVRLSKPVRKAHLRDCLLLLLDENARGGDEEARHLILTPQVPHRASPIGEAANNRRQPQAASPHLDRTPNSWQDFSLNVWRRTINRLREIAHRPLAAAPILIAEDNEVNQKLILLQMKQLGYAAELVSNGREAVDALGRGRYAAVLMDCQMPLVDGYEAATEIRRREKYGRRTPIIALTAHALQADREKCLAAGMDDYLSKPVKTADLQRILERWQPFKIKAAATREEMTSDQDDRPQTTEAPLLIDMAQLREVSENDGEYLDSLITLYLEQTSQELTRLAAAVAAESFAEIERIAHLCAGSSATCGVVSLVPIFRELERIGQHQQQLSAAARPLAAAQSTFRQVEAAFQKMKDENQGREHFS
jgi:two-component system, sensor histidine kinase and response regulator